MTRSHERAIAHVAGLADDGPAAGRPKYAALNFRRRVVGGSPRFGSAHRRPTASVMERATFCYPDSFWQPEHARSQMPRTRPMSCSMRSMD
jgi:hypothetical protein